MKCSGVVIYKGIEKRDGGVFKNDKGNEVSYDSSYIVKFDENKDGKIDERKVKFPSTNIALYDKFKAFEAYAKVEIVFDVVISTSTCKLVPIDVMKK